jgi:hypothetical protein
MSKTQCGSTALIRAAENGHTECVRLLLAGGANKDFTGQVSFDVMLTVFYLLYAYILFSSFL